MHGNGRERHHRGHAELWTKQPPWAASYWLTWEHHVASDGCPQPLLDPVAHARHMVAVLQQPPRQLQHKRTLPTVSMRW